MKKPRLAEVWQGAVIISRRGKHRIALWKAPFCFTESSRGKRQINRDGEKENRAE